MIPVPLAFLNLGATELVLVAVVFLLFFGVDKLPAAGRAIGRLQGEWSRARKQVERELRSEEDREDDRLREFERKRELQIRHQSPEFLEEVRVRDAARSLGIEDADTAPVASLRDAIAKAVSPAEKTKKSDVTDSRRV